MTAHEKGRLTPPLARSSAILALTPDGAMTSSDRWLTITIVWTERIASWIITIPRPLIPSITIDWFGGNYALCP